MNSKRTIYAADFETTVYEGQTRTDVWSAAVVELEKDEVQVFGSLPKFWRWLTYPARSAVVYFHNLKFDGSFLLDYFMSVLHLRLAARWDDEDVQGTFRWIEDHKMVNGQYKYCIADTGAWYWIKVKYRNRFIEFRDSFKLLPMSLAKLGKDFGTQHQKLDMVYEGYRYPNCPISDEELEYIKNDVLVLKEALEITFAEGHKKLTIGACCMEEYKTRIMCGEEEYRAVFPDMTQEPVPDYLQGMYRNADDYIRKSYRGGWCYVVPQKAGRVIHNGLTADVNSLYPSVMHSESGSYYPVGRPNWWKGPIPDFCDRDPAIYYFVHLRCRFTIRPGYLPTIQVKHSFRYAGNEYLTTSDYFDKELGEYCRYYRDAYTGEIRESTVELTLTCTDWALLQEHYILDSVEVLDGCWFRAELGVFDEYINKYRKIKETSKGAQRTLAKLYLNNLYGKQAASDRADFKVAYWDDEEQKVGYMALTSNDKEPGYIPVGSAITSYARNFTIRAAQKNYHGPDKPGFIYADTDSLHCDLPEDQLQGIPVHDTAFCHWKIESHWKQGIFVRQKTYIEEVQDQKYQITAAGMGSGPKELLARNLRGDYPTTDDDEQSARFLLTRRTLVDFRPGLMVPGQLKARTIPGGQLLVSVPYELR